MLCFCVITRIKNAGESTRSFSAVDDESYAGQHVKILARPTHNDGYPMLCILSSELVRHSILKLMQVIEELRNKMELRFDVLKLSQKK